MKPIPTLPGYLATEDGRIFKGQKELTQHEHERYMRVWTRVDGRKLRKRVHRLVLMAFRGLPENGAEGRHLDGNRYHNALSNLEWGTHADNMQDSIRHGTFAALRTGDNAIATRIPFAKVLQMREQRKTMKLKQIADLHGVDISYVSGVCLNKIRVNG
jgi:hypothetical protein